MKVLAIFLALISVGCFKKHGLVDNEYPPVAPLELYDSGPVVYSPGSLYQDAHAAAGLISDSRAFRVNDIVLISISESTSATNSANTDLEKKNSNSFKVPNLFGIEKTHSQFFGLGSTDGTVLGTSTESEHEGKGTTTGSAVFSGNVATRVVRVLPNGYLIIQGNKTVQVNDEMVRVYLSGIVNPLMIDRDHTVTSNQVADLHLRYGGNGVISAQQSPGLFSRIINMLWPF